MFVFKFGGASIKDSDGIRNLLHILHTYSDNLVIVVSALGKTTNALEEILKLSNLNEAQCLKNLQNLKNLHLQIMNDLFVDNSSNIYSEIDIEFDQLKNVLFDERYNYSYDLKYDQVVSFGEIFSTKIVNAFLNSQNYNSHWVDIRNVFFTDDTYREAKVDYSTTKARANEYFTFSNTKSYITQGFIGKSKKGFVTTLGREGSDYTAAVLANLLDAQKVIVWKDVEGILNADPQYFQETWKLDEISYQEAVELAYFGAKVIHPKTLKPLHNKNIPLYVKSFLNPEAKGTVIECFKKYNQDLPIFILKKDQMLISLFPKDLSFVIEHELSKIFQYLSEHRIKVNLIQNSAISVSFCVDNSNSKVKELLERLQEDYKVLYNDQLELLTIRHYTNDAIVKVTSGRKIYIEQRSRHTAHFVIK